MSLTCARLRTTRLAVSAIKSGSATPRPRPRLTELFPKELSQVGKATDVGSPVSLATSDPVTATLTGMGWVCAGRLLARDQGSNISSHP